MFKAEIHTEELDEFIKDLTEDLKSVKGAKAGWFEGKKYPDRETKGKKKISGIEIAKNALIQEYGTDKIPSRPFMRLTIAKNQEKWKKLIEEFYDPEGDGLNLESVMDKIGGEMAGDMKRSIGSNIPPPNSPITVKRKRGSTRTLMDTGLLRQSIHWEVIKK